MDVDGATPSVSLLLVESTTFCILLETPTPTASLSICLLTSCCFAIIASFIFSFKNSCSFVKGSSSLPSLDSTPLRFLYVSSIVGVFCSVSTVCSGATVSVTFGVTFCFGAVIFCFGCRTACSISSSVTTPRFLRVRSNMPCTNAPTAPPYAASSPVCSKKSCCGLYPLSIAFCKILATASCPASIPPDAVAL